MNLNDEFLFTLTDRGKTLFAYTSYGKTHKPEADGRYKLQLWEAMNVFGPQLCMGFDGPIETEIEPVTVTQGLPTVELKEGDTVRYLEEPELGVILKNPLQGELMIVWDGNAWELLQYAEIECLRRHNPYDPALVGRLCHI